MPCAYPTSIQGTHKGHPYKKIIHQFSNANKSTALSIAKHQLRAEVVAIFPSGWHVVRG
jgi:hypothetical protein